MSERGMQMQMTRVCFLRELFKGGVFGAEGRG